MLARHNYVKHVEDIEEEQDNIKRCTNHYTRIHTHTPVCIKAKRFGNLFPDEIAALQVAIIAIIAKLYLQICAIIDYVFC